MLRNLKKHVSLQASGSNPKFDTNALQFSHVDGGMYDRPTKLTLSESEKNVQLQKIDSTISVGTEKTVSHELNRLEHCVTNSEFTNSAHHSRYQQRSAAGIWIPTFFYPMELSYTRSSLIG